MRYIPGYEIYYWNLKKNDVVLLRVVLLRVVLLHVVLLHVILLHVVLLHVVLTVKIMKPNEEDRTATSSQRIFNRRSVLSYYDGDKKRSCISVPRRYVVCLMTFFGLFLMYALRLNLSVAIVTMTSNRSISLPNGTVVVQKANFNWNPKDKGYILSAFFYGYVVAQIPGGWLGGRFGGVPVLGCGVLFAALCTLTIPFFANHGGTMAIMVLRTVTGLFQGCTYPCIHAIWSRWAPAEERAKLSSISFLGANSSIVFCWCLYGVLTHYYGWSLLFYVPGFASLIWCCIWFSCVKSNPKDDNRITEEELNRLQETVVEFTDGKNTNYAWKSIFTSKPVWAIIVANFVVSWCDFTMYTELPSYFKDYYGINMNGIGYLSIPYTVSIFLIPLSGITADWFTKSGYSVTSVRKNYLILSNIGQACACLLLGYSTSADVAVILLTMYMSFNCVMFGSFHVNHLDIAPSYACLLMGISNTAGCLGGVISPIVTGYILTYQGKEGWCTVFFIMVGLLGFSTVFYVTFASGKLQSWAQQNSQLSKENNSDDNQCRRHHHRHETIECRR